MQLAVEGRPHYLYTVIQDSIPPSYKRREEGGWNEKVLVYHFCEDY